MESVQPHHIAWKKVDDVFKIIGEYDDDDDDDGDDDGDGDDAETIEHIQINMAEPIQNSTKYIIKIMWWNKTTNSRQYIWWNYNQHIFKHFSLPGHHIK